MRRLLRRLGCQFRRHDWRWELDAGVGYQMFRCRACGATKWIEPRAVKGCKEGWD